MTDTHDLIRQQLEIIEQEEHVRILYACESGSRAWGFPSKDSDFDVRFLYVRPVEWYLSVFEKRDVIERPISNMLDINGWDLRKALALFRKSNPPLMEWLQSPIQYVEKHTVAQQLRSHSALAFAPRSCLFHYLNMAKGNYRDYLQGEQVRIKKYFYVLRPILACEWIEQWNSMPPMEFERLMDAVIPQQSELKETIQELLIRKKAGDELDYEPKLSIIHDYLEERIRYLEGITASFKKASDFPEQQIDSLFRDALKEVWG